MPFGADLLAKIFGVFNPGGAGSEVIKDLPISTEEKNERDKRNWQLKFVEYFRERLARSDEKDSK